MSQVLGKPQPQGEDGGEDEEEDELVGLAGYEDGPESSDAELDSGPEEGVLDFSDPFSTEVKPRILLMGLRRSGKSSIQKVVFHKMSPSETLFLESTNRICREDVSNSSFVNFHDHRSLVLGGSICYLTRSFICNNIPHVLCLFLPRSACHQLALQDRRHRKPVAGGKKKEA